MSPLEQTKKLELGRKRIDEMLMGLSELANELLKDEEFDLSRMTAGVSSHMHELREAMYKRTNELGKLGL